MKFEYPQNPFYPAPNQWNMISCPDDIPEEGVKCTQVLTVELGDLVELRLVGAENPENKISKVHVDISYFPFAWLQFSYSKPGSRKIGSQRDKDFKLRISGLFYKLENHFS